MKNLKKVGIIALAFAPAVAFAQNATQLFALLNIVQKVLGYLMPILITLGVLYVAWGIISFVTKSNEEERQKAKGIILYGVIGLAAIVSLWGLVAFIQYTLGIGGGGLNSNQIPCVIDNDTTQAGCQ
jgi:hypothetical protein